MSKVKPNGVDAGTLKKSVSAHKHAVRHCGKPPVSAPALTTGPAATGKLLRPNYQEEEARVGAHEPKGSEPDLSAETT